MHILDRLSRALTDRYRIERELGAGGMATVYLAHDLKHDRAVAIKVLRPELSASLGAQRFLREIRIAAQLHHPHILSLLDSGEADGLLYYVMPFVEGASLRERIAREGALPLQDVVRILHELADALAAAHVHGVVHRDVKPENVLLEGRHVTVVDFGVAKALSEATGAAGLTTSGLSIGTPAYMAPEQIAGEAGVDHRADIYALGLIAYEMLTGVAPFTGATVQQVVAAHMTEQPPSISRRRPTTPAPLVALVMKCLEKRPADRWQSAEELLPELATLAVPSGSSAATVPRTRRRWTMPATIAVITLMLVIGGWRLSRRATGSSSDDASIHSIAVLPFAERNTDGSEFFGDGMAETLIFALGKVAGLKVAAQTSAFSFKGKEVDLGTIGEKLNVAAVLTGSFQRSGNRLRVTVHLERVSDQSELWTARYERELSDVFALQDDIARAVVNRLRSGSGRANGARIVDAGTSNVEAYQAYLQGRYFWSKRGEGLNKALPFFERAVALDSNYALAWTGIADTYSLQVMYGQRRSIEGMPKARRAVERALALDSTLAPARTALAFLLQTYDWDWKGADREYRRAIDLDPSYVVAHYWYANFLCGVSGRYADGLVQSREAVTLDPLSPHAANINSQSLSYVGKHEEAIAESRRAVSLESAWGNYRVLGFVLRRSGRLREAIGVLDTAIAVSGRHPRTLMELGLASVEAGDSASARSLYGEIAAKADAGLAQPTMAAALAGALGKTEDAMRWLERARNEHDAVLGAAPSILFFSRAAAFHRDPRFLQFWTNLGIAVVPDTGGKSGEARLMHGDNVPPRVQR